MEKDTIKNIFNFLEENEGKRSFLWKLINDESLTDEELIVKGDLDLNSTRIKTLPKGLKVGGYLFLKDCSNLTSLPEGLEVGWFLSLQNCTSLASLPKGLKVDKHLYIKNTPLAKFSDDELRKMIKPGFVKGLILK